MSGTFGGMGAGMTGGVDRGPCFSYWRLSYRRKFIRTLWTAAIFLPLLLLFQVTGVFRWQMRTLRIPDAEWYGWLLVAVGVVTAVVQAGYTYLRWRRGLCGTAEPPPHPTGPADAPEPPTGGCRG